MALPNDEIIVGKLLSLLYQQQDGTLHCQTVYEELAKNFPCLTIEETQKPYKCSKSHWANRVQFARLHCVNSGYILNEKNGRGRGFWTITKQGRQHIDHGIQF